jgi:uncharacterized protein YjbI with pentapeptide repeats
MNSNEIKTILDLHKLWLSDSGTGKHADLSHADLSHADLSCVNLSGADLKGAYLPDADLRGADLRGANLDYACWPLSCKSLSVTADAQLVGQLLYHALDLAKYSGVDVGICDTIRELANSSKVVLAHGKEKL